MNNQKETNYAGTNIDELGAKIAAWGIAAMIMYLVFIDK
jgi:hypothetical protein